MLRRLTDPSHQGGQDLQVLGLLDVKEGEGSQEESEDSLGDRNRSEGGPEAGLHTARHVRGERAVHTASAQGRVSPSPGARWPGRGSLGVPVSGCTEPQRRFSAGPHTDCPEAPAKEFPGKSQTTSWGHRRLTSPQQTLTKDSQPSTELGTRIQSSTRHASGPHRLLGREDTGRRDPGALTMQWRGGDTILKGLDERTHQDAVNQPCF